MEEKNGWITPQEAARRVSERAGYIVTPDDLKQLRRRGKIKETLRVNSQIILYHDVEIDTVEPPKKRVRVSHEEWEAFLERERQKRRKVDKDAA